MLTSNKSTEDSESISTAITSLTHVHNVLRASTHPPQVLSILYVYVLIELSCTHYVYQQGRKKMF